MIDVIIGNLIREGIDKHRARELAAHFIKHMAQPKQEPVAWHVDFGNEDEPNYACLKKPDEPAAHVRPLVYDDAAPPQRTWAKLIRGVRVEGDTVVISVVGGNDGARELCGALINELEQAKQ